MMNPFAHFERLAERIFEHDLPRVLGGALDPLELTRAIDRALAAVPSDYPPPAALRIELGEQNWKALAGRAAAVEGELSRYAGARVRERWQGQPPDPSVRLVHSPALPGREVRVQPEAVPPGAGATTALPPTPGAGIVVLNAALQLGERWVPVARLPFAIGRALDNDLVLDHPSVSRYHAQLRQEAGRIVLVDLQSTNGSFVNGQRVAGRTQLAEGDRLLIGRVALRFRHGPRP
jgi:hypothetical protein